jgi:predicted nuclease of predicted toxin-antitoxin system
MSKDADFHQRSFVVGHTPKVVWIERGNCSTDEIHQILYKNREAIKDFGDAKESSFLILE